MPFASAVILLLGNPGWFTSVTKSGRQLVVLANLATTSRRYKQLSDSSIVRRSLLLRRSVRTFAGEGV
jgi:hypothetical protein